MLSTNPYFYMTLLGLGMKIWATVRYCKTETKIKGANCVLCFEIFLVVLFIQAAFELSNYLLLNTARELFINIAMYGYYVSTFAAITLLPLSMAYLTRQTISKWILFLALLTFLIFSYLTVFTSYLIVGFEAMQYFYTRVVGQYYYVFQVYVILVLLFTVSLLYFESKTAKIQINKIKASNMLIGLIPVAALITIIMILMRVGYEINVAGFIPAMLSLFILSIADNLNEDNIVDYRIYLPWTKEARLIRRISEPFSRINYTYEVYKDNPKLYEQMLIKHAISMFNTRREAAKWLGVSESKISRALKDRQ